MTLKKMLIIALGAALLSGCAQVERIKQTKSGKPEGFYPNQTKEKVSGALVATCNEKGLIVYDAKPEVVICGKELEGGAALLTQATIGNAYSTPPIAKIRYTISQINSDVKVWADMWTETQMAMGQVNSMNIQDNQSFNSVQRLLDGLKVN